MADPIIRICKRGSRPAIQSRYRRDCVQRASKAIESCQFAPVTVRANGMPCASTTICRLVSSFPRSVGLGPVSWPPGGWPHWPHQYWHGSNQFGRARAAFAAGPGAASPRLRRPASRAVDASTSSRCQSPVLAATPPKECPSAGHTRCRSTLLGHQSNGVGHLFGKGQISVSGAPALSTTFC